MLMYFSLPVKRQDFCLVNPEIQMIEGQIIKLLLYLVYIYMLHKHCKVFQNVRKGVNKETLLNNGLIVFLTFSILQFLLLLLLLFACFDP